MALAGSAIDCYIVQVLNNGIAPAGFVDKRVNGKYLKVQRETDRLKNIIDNVAKFVE